MSNLNQQNQNISSGNLIKEIPYGQTNVSTVDPTPGFICAFVFLPYSLFYIKNANNII